MPVQYLVLGVGTGIGVGVGVNTGFSDVAADAWYVEAAFWCRENGIMSGTSGTAFSPNTTMTP